MSLESKNVESRLSAISTNWEDIIESRGDSAGEQRNRVLIRYSNCVYRYILQASKNADIADDLSQEFALRFVRGDYVNADPSKGRFRDYLRASLRNLITDHFRKNRELALSNSAAERLPDNHVDQQLAELDRDFQQNWREQVLGLAWEGLRDSDAGRTSDYYTVLRFRSLNADANSKEMAEQLSIQLGKPVTAEWVRQKLSRARQKFASLLAIEVRQSLNINTEDAIREELTALGLSKYLDR
jgi:RNA polymerase sigma-70 factor (ECF subfamily)